MSNRVNISCSTHPSRFCLIFPSTNIIHTHTHSYTYIISLIRRCTMSAFVYVGRVCSSIARVYDAHIYGSACVCIQRVRPCLGLPRVNEYAAVAGWLVKTVALLAYPFLSPLPSSGPSGTSLILQLPSYTSPSRLSNSRRLSTAVSPLPLPSRPARRFFPRFPYLSDIPLPASTRVDIRLIRLKSWREATNYYAS